MSVESISAVRCASQLDGDNYELLRAMPGQTIDEWLDAEGLRSQLYQQPCVLELNGNQICERDYGYVLRNGDHVALVVYPQGAILALPFIQYTLAAVAVAAVTALVLPGMVEPDVPATADQNDGSPLYSTSVKGNRYRPGSRGAILYGTTRVVPDFSQPPFSVFDANDQQHYYMRFRVTQGRASVDVGSAQFDETPLSNFSDYQVEVIEPGERSVLVPASVILSETVSDIELQDSASAAHVVCGVGERVNRVEFDVAAPALYKQHKEKGTIKLYTVELDCELQAIDDSGAAVGTWFNAGRVSLSNADRTAVRRTFGFDVAEGRYQARMVRATAKNDSVYVQDTVRWVGLKGFEQDDTASDCTEVALVLRSSDQVGNRALTNFSVVASRLLPTWSAEYGWGGLIQTNHFAWAMADLCRAEYAGRRSDAHYKLNQLAALAARADLSGAEFNAYFDTEGVSVWDALERAGMPGRVRAIDYAGQYWFVRDELQAQPVQHFTMRNIVAGSYSKKLPGFVTESADSVIVKFRDKTQNWKLYNDGDGLLCKVPESPGLNPREVTLFGVDDPAEARKIGLWLAASSAYRREQPQWQTGSEGRIPFFGRQVSVSHFVLGYEGRQQISGDVLAVDASLAEVLLSEPVPDGLTDPRIIFRDNRGAPTLAYPVQVLDAKRCRVQVQNFDDGGSGVALDWSQVRVGDRAEEPTQFALGDGVEFVDLVKVTKVARNGERVQLQGYVDDPRVYLLSEDVTPPEGWSPAGAESLVPAVNNLQALLFGSLADPEILLQWESVNCDYVEVQVSTDGINYSAYGGRFVGTELRIDVEPGHYWFRVYGFNILRGQPAVVDIDTAAVLNTPPPAPVDLVLREAFNGPVLRLGWTAYTERHLISVLVGGVEQYFTVLDVGAQWDFAADLAREHGVGRSFTVRVYSVGENTLLSDGYAELVVSNDPPALLSNLVVTALGGNALVRFDLQPEPDVLGVSVWMGEATGFAVGDASKVVSLSTAPVVSVPIGRDSTKYLIVAAEDAWGGSGLNYSGEFSVRGTLITETEIGPESIKSPHIAANQITAIHTFIDQLSAISADMGTVVAGLFKTSASGSAARVELDSAGTMPFWIGEFAKLAENGHAYYDSAAKAFVFQDPVTGVRLEIEPGGSMPIWLGAGAKIPENSFLHINAATGLLVLRGVQVLNGNGSVAFSSAGGISYENVSGLGSFATKSGLNYSELNGSKPPTNANYTINTNQLTDGAGLGATANWGSVGGRPASLGDLDSSASGHLSSIQPGADVTSQHTAAGIANQGAFATLGQVTTANWSTYIQAAIVDQKIAGRVNIVDTLQLKGQTVVVAATHQSSSRYTLTTSWGGGITRGIAMANAISTSAIDILIQADWEIEGGDVNANEGNNVAVHVRLLRGGQVLKEWVIGRAYYANLEEGIELLAWTDQPGAGSFYYTVEYKYVQNGLAPAAARYINYRYIRLSGAKR